MNVTGAATCAKHAADHLRASDRGSVVNIGSIGGKLPDLNRVPYAVSKVGLVGLTRTLAYELGRDDVTVNTGLPGPVAGDRIEDVVAKQQRLADVEDAEPYGIDGDDFALPEYVVGPEEVAEQVAYSPARTAATSRPRRSASMPAGRGTDHRGLSAAGTRLGS